MLTTREKWTKIIRGRILFCIQNFFINTTFLELYIIGSYIHITDGLFKPWSLHKLFNSFQTILIFILFNIWIFLIKHTMINKIIISLKLCRKSFLFSCPLVNSYCCCTCTRSVFDYPCFFCRKSSGINYYYRHAKFKVR